MIYRKLKVLKALLILLAIPLLSLSQNVSAESIAQENQLQPVSCFGEGMYEFQSVSVVLRTSDTTFGKTFSEGEVIEFSGYIKNENPYPVVDGNIYARISSSNDGWRTEGFNIVDEFFIAENINIDANSQLPVSFSWTVPENLPTDDYRVDYFFSVDKKFNLGGLPFTNEITAGDIEFKIDNSKEKLFYLDRTDTKVNDEKYLHIGGWPYLDSNSPFVATQPIQNLSNEKIDVDVTYEFYYWDSIKNENLIDTKNETISIDPQSEATLSYENNNLDTSVGYLKITAESQGVKSIINIRFSTELNDTRLNYAAVNKFPLAKGDAFKVFTCAYNTVGESSDNTISLTLKDKKGKVIATDEYAADLSTSIDGYAMDLIAKDDYQFLTLETVVKDSNGNILTSYTADYDCSVLNSEKCVEEIIEEYDNNIMLYTIAAILLLLLLIAVAFVSKKTKKDNKALMSILLIGLVISSSYLISNLVYRTDVATAQLISLDGTYKQAKPSNTNNDIGWSDRWLARNLWIERNLQGIMYTSDNNFNPNNAVIGDMFYIGISDTCKFYGTEGRWNTPYCGEAMSLVDSANGNNGKVIMSNVPWSPSIKFDSSKVECVKESNASHSSLYKCTIKDSGTFNVGTTIAGGNTTMYACSAIGGNKEARVSSNNSNHNYPNCETSNPTPSTNPDNIIGFDRINGSNTRWINGTTFTWTLNVQEPDPINGECGDSDGRYYPSTYDPDDLDQCDSGIEGDVSLNNGIFSWDCEEQYGGETVSCATVVPDCIGSGCDDTDDPDNPNVNNLTISCAFETPEGDLIEQDQSLQIGSQITARVQSTGDISIDPDGVEYTFENGPDFVHTGGLELIGADQYDSSDNYRNYSISEAGVYQINANMTYYGEDVGPVLCSGNYNDHIIAIGDIPEISFSIDPELGNADNECLAEISIEGNNTEGVSCEIELETGETFNNSSELTNGYDGNIPVTAGTSYRLVCDLTDTENELINSQGAIEDLLSTPLDRCVVNPDLRQN